jgi:glycerol-3-phosphate acyltransferase PlsY
VALLIFVLVLLTWRYVSLGSIAAAAAMPLLVALFERREVPVALTVVVAALVVYKHKENIQRLRDGTENRFKA